VIRHTAADVEQYIAANPPPGAVKGTPAPTVASIQFEPEQEAVAQYPGISNSSPTDPVCVVVVSGTFMSDGGYPPLLPPGTAYPTPALFYQGVMIFDGYTGNLLATNFA
jgi:hypothetical protein